MNQTAWKLGSVLFFFAVTILPGRAGAALPADLPDENTHPAQIWANHQGMDHPESAFYDRRSDSIYVSNMAGGPIDRNHKGFLQKLTASGAMVNTAWATGLNSPKGIRTCGDQLYTTDIDEVRVYHIGEGQGHHDGELLARIPTPAAQCLNDIDVAADGTIYTSDIFGNKIFRVKAGLVEVFAQGDELESPNGVLIGKTELYVVGSDLHYQGHPDFEHSKKKGHLYALDLTTRRKRVICSEALGMLDALEMDNNGNFLVSDYWGSSVIRVSPDGVPVTLFTILGRTADFSFDPVRNRLVVPFSDRNSVRAFAYDRLPSIHDR